MPDLPQPPMIAADHGEITQLLQDWREGRPDAVDALVPFIYRELHQLANSYLRREKSSHTLQPTALVNEVYLRLAGGSVPAWESRKHFYGVAARLMRQVLVDHARKHLAGKRGDGAVVLSLDEALVYSKQNAAEFTALDEALERLAEFDERKARAIELRYFIGLTVEEMAQVLEVSPVTVQRDLRFATAWLSEQLGGR
ncbi:sigma-70 family RNA polymerase sigma factor [Bryobacter aggregatus]|uniref:sigma-70 family RNA polymerase sigma factor n=1 Tax=Bryobacter aggregatus TaxID=360054 RepID=UPI001EE1715E|nr:sigma-70 family RNA polymerase sigma factor [Bryobacter aggregatus]